MNVVVERKTVFLLSSVTETSTQEEAHSEEAKQAWLARGFLAEADDSRLGIETGRKAVAAFLTCQNHLIKHHPAKPIELVTQETKTGRARFFLRPTSSKITYQEFASLVAEIKDAIHKQ